MKSFLPLHWCLSNDESFYELKVVIYIALFQFFFQFVFQWISSKNIRKRHEFDTMGILVIWVSHTTLFSCKEFMFHLSVALVSYLLRFDSVPLRLAFSVMTLTFDIFSWCMGYFFTLVATSKRHSFFRTHKYSFEWTFDRNIAVTLVRLKVIFYTFCPLERRNCA